MSSKLRATPTDSELRILKVLWEGGPATARAVLEALQERSRAPIGYTTVLKLLQVMEKKGTVRVDRSARSHVYAARIAERSTLRRAVTEFVDRTFDGRPADLLVHLVKEGRLDDETLAKLERSIQALRDQEEGDEG